MSNVNGLRPGPACYRSGQSAETRNRPRRQRRSGLGPTAMGMVIKMAELTIGDMVKRVPQGQSQLFTRTSADPGEEHYFQVRQSWDYEPARLEWRNLPPLVQAPWAGTRKKARAALATLPPPDVVFMGPAKDVVDFYTAVSHAFFVSDPLFRLIDGIDLDSLEHVEFLLRAEDAEIPFHLVMPARVVEAVDTSRTTILVKDDGKDGIYFRRVRFPDGIAFDNDALQGAASFSDLDAPGWYWSKALLEQAQAHGIRGLYAQSVASSPAKEIARL
jgi:hypothetical protein